MLLTSIQGDKRRGLNRLAWPERAKPPKVPPAAGLVENQFLFFGPQAQEGTYTVKLTKGKETYTSEFKLVPDPRSKSTPADRAEQHKVVTRLYTDLAQLTYVVDATNDLRDQVKARAAAATDAQLKDQLNNLLQQLNDFRETLVSVKRGEQSPARRSCASTSGSFTALSTATLDGRRNRKSSALP